MIRSVVFSWMFVVTTAAAGDERVQTIRIGSVELALGIPQARVLDELRTNTPYLVTRFREFRWIVSDKARLQAVAVLTFGRDGRLHRIEKNWTPHSDDALSLADSMASLLAQLPPDARSCRVSVFDTLQMGPYTWVRDPGHPDVKVRRIDLACGAHTIQLYVEEPTAATQVNSDVLGIRKVLLYQTISDLPDAPSPVPASSKHGQ